MWPAHADHLSVRTSRMTRAILATFAVAIASLAGPALAAADNVKADTQGPADVTATTATFSARVALPALGTVTWDYGTTTAYGMTTAAVQTTVVGAKQDVSLLVTGLLPDTTYHVRVTASSVLTVLQGKDVKFNTKKADPKAAAVTVPAPPTTTAPATTTPPTPAAPAPAPAPAPATPRKDDHSTSSPSRGSGLDDAKIDDDGTDGGATAPPGQATASIAPDFGHSVAAAAVAGTVSATAPTGATVDLTAAQTIPTGTLIDARRGTVELKTALDGSGRTQTARFWGARFEVHQNATRRGLTQLVLRGADFGACPKASRQARASTASKRKRPARSLWGSDDHGRFQTRGRGSVATVRGTRWVTTDTCAGTRTTVLKGAVAVKDERHGKTILVTKGHSYLARTTAR
jgi:hypothetical protein